MGRIRRRLAVVLTAFALTSGLLGGHAAQGADVVDLDLGPLGKSAALDSCATQGFVDGKPGQLSVRYGMLQRTRVGSRGSFVLRNHAGRLLFCDMFGRQTPAVRPIPTSSPQRPAVIVTNSIQEWPCTKSVLFRTNLWLKVQDPVRSARMRYWVNGEPGPWFTSRRQGRFVHLQSWLAPAPRGAVLKMQTQVRNGAGRVMDVKGLPSRPKRLFRACGTIIG